MTRRNDVKNLNLLSSCSHLTSLSVFLWHLKEGSNNYSNLMCLGLSKGESFPCGSPGKKSTRNVGDLGWEDTLEKEKATHSNILAWRIPWAV